jgi:hypothetical protein
MIGPDELSSVKGLMTMSLNAIICDVFALMPDQVVPQLRIVADLKMSAAQAAQLRAMIAEFFDGRHLELTPSTTLGEIFNFVIEKEFVDLPHQR